MDAGAATDREAAFAFRFPRRIGTGVLSVFTSELPVRISPGGSPRSINERKDECHD